MLIDGEHYAPVIAAALADLEAAGEDVVAAVLVGGTEKLIAGALDRLGVPVLADGEPGALLRKALDGHRPDAVMDLSDEPVLDYRRRHTLAAAALGRGVAYRGADFTFTPPPRPKLSERPSVAVIGTGKRTGKTAVAGFAARTLAGAGRAPVVVAMGRGGPPEPEVLRGDEVTLDARALIELADRGLHAASDYVEDALLARVPTVGCRRCGGGLAGAVGFSNVAAGVAVANRITADIALLEGSGAAIPPVHADATILVTPASVPLEYLAGYMGPYRLLLADVVMVTMAEDPFGSASQVSSVVSSIHDVRARVTREAPPGGIEVIRTVFRPAPTRSVEGADVIVATTAPAAAGAVIRRHLEREHRCTVRGISHSLSDRSALQKEFEAMERADLLLCEVKAAGIDVAARWAVQRGIEVAFMDNVPVGVDGDDPSRAVVRAAELADERFGREPLGGDEGGA